MALVLAQGLTGFSNTAQRPLQATTPRIFNVTLIDWLVANLDALEQTLFTCLSDALRRVAQCVYWYRSPHCQGREGSPLYAECLLGGSFEFADFFAIGSGTAGHVWFAATFSTCERGELFD